MRGFSFEAIMGPSEIKVGLILTNSIGLKFEVVEIAGWDKVTCRFISTGFEFTTQKSNILRGFCKDRLHPNKYGAYYGDGKYLESLIHIGTKPYYVWRNMIARCYNKSSPFYKFYGGKGVVVCSEWMNYQNFAKWFVENYPNDGGRYEIDKDLLGGGLYSPSTCVFMTSKENSVQANAKRYMISYVDGTSEIVLSLSEYAKKTGRSQAVLSRIANEKLKKKIKNKDILSISEIAK